MARLAPRRLAAGLRQRLAVRRSGDPGGPVVLPVDETASRRFARIVGAREHARRPRVPLERLGRRKERAGTR